MIHKNLWIVLAMEAAQAPEKVVFSDLRLPKWDKLSYFLRVKVWYKYFANCDHDWQTVDDSFSHEFGTEIIVYQRCNKCDLCQDCEPYDYDPQPDDYI